MKIYKIKEICHLEKGKQIDTTLLNDNNPYKYINGGIKQTGYYTSYNTEGEAVLVSEGGASCGYVNYINEKFWCGCHCYKLTECKCLTKYLYYALKGNQDKLMALRTGTAMPNIKKSTFQAMELNLNENIFEQETVINTLDKVQLVIDAKKAELNDLDVLVKSRFIEMFGDPIANSFNVKTKPMTEVCEIIDGDRGKNYPTAEEFLEEGYCLFLNTKNVTSSGFNFETCMFVTKEKDEILRNGKLKRGDVVLTTRGTIGNIAFYTDKIPYEHIRINSGMVILRMHREEINEIYFIEQFKMQLADIKGKIANGSAQPQLPISKMNKIQVLLPDINLQNKFAKFVRQVDKSKFSCYTSDSYN